MAACCFAPSSGSQSSTAAAASSASTRSIAVNQVRSSATSCGLPRRLAVGRRDCTFTIWSLRARLLPPLRDMMRKRGDHRSHAFNEVGELVDPSSRRPARFPPSPTSSQSDRSLYVEIGDAPQRRGSVKGAAHPASDCIHRVCGAKCTRMPTSRQAAQQPDVLADGLATSESSGGVCRVVSADCIQEKHQRVSGMASACRCDVPCPLRPDDSGCPPRPHTALFPTYAGSRVHAPGGAVRATGRAWRRFHLQGQSAPRTARELMRFSCSSHPAVGRGE